MFTLQTIILKNIYGKGLFCSQSFDPLNTAWLLSGWMSKLFEFLEIGYTFSNLAAVYHAQDILFDYNIVSTRKSHAQKYLFYTFCPINLINKFLF